MGQRAAVLLVRRAGFALAALALLAGCHRASVGAGGQRVDARAFDAFYLWPGVQPPQGGRPRVLYLLDGEVQRFLVQVQRAVRGEDPVHQHLPRERAARGRGGAGEAGAGVRAFAEREREKQAWGRAAGPGREGARPAGAAASGVHGCGCAAAPRLKRSRPVEDT